jgi:hypothetical protein
MRTLGRQKIYRGGSKFSCACLLAFTFTSIGQFRFHGRFHAFHFGLHLMDCSFEGAPRGLAQGIIWNLVYCKAIVTMLEIYDSSLSIPSLAQQISWGIELVLTLVRNSRKGLKRRMGNLLSSNSGEGSKKDLSTMSCCTTGRFLSNNSDR